MDKLIITVAPVGAETTRQDNPQHPYTVDEMVHEATLALQAGASVVHLHVRNDDGTPSQDPARFQAVMERLQQLPGGGPIVQISTGGAVSATVEERLAPVKVLEPRPEMASLTCGTVNFGNDVFWNPPDMLVRFAETMKARGIVPELEIFEAGMITNAMKLAKQGLLPEHLHFDLVLGVPGAMAGTPRNLLFLVESLPSGASWTVAGTGRTELPLALMAILMGGHVRVGFEDNVYYRKGELATSNAQLVERVVRLARELDREVATPAEARQILGIGETR